MTLNIDTIYGSLHTLSNLRDANDPRANRGKNDVILSISLANKRPQQKTVKIPKYMCAFYRIKQCAKSTCYLSAAIRFFCDWRRVA